MKELVGLHGPLAVNVDATMWHDYLGTCCVYKHACVGGERGGGGVCSIISRVHIVWGSMQT